MKRKILLVISLLSLGLVAGGCTPDEYAVGGAAVGAIAGYAVGREVGRDHAHYYYDGPRYTPPRRGYGYYGPGYYNPRSYRGVPSYGSSRYGRYYR